MSREGFAQKNKPKKKKFPSNYTECSERKEEYLRLGCLRRCSPGPAQAVLQNCLSVKRLLLWKLPCQWTLKTDLFHQGAPLLTSAGGQGQ